MVAVKGYQADAFLAARHSALSAVLFYGTDGGLVSERAARLAKRLAQGDPPGEIIRLDDASLEDEPERMLLELDTVPMFGGRRIVRALAGRRITAHALRARVESGPQAAFLIVEAGNLRPGDALRALFENSPTAAAVACFSDEVRDLDTVVEEVLAAAGLAITPPARKLLIARLGADRGLSRSEIDKLATYAHGRGAIEESDVEAVVGDGAELTLDRIVLAAGAGQTALALAECDRSIAAGESAQTVIGALQRHFLRLHRMRTALDAGRPADDVIRSLRPPPHFKQRAALERQSREWSTRKLNAALARIGKAAKAARLNGALETTLAEELLLAIGGMARERK